MLPGKLCIGILEEDNPQKSYFRLKPLLIENGGKYEVFDSAELYPEDGCIRVVPDKNESSRFKARMRCMGRYCILDLRQHAGDSDKIRPNKNYHNDETERNANIVYSDVIREPAEDMIYEIVQSAEDGCVPFLPGSSRILIGDSQKIWQCIPQEGIPGVRIEPEDRELEEEEIQRFRVPGFADQTLDFAIRLPGKMDSVIAEPAAEVSPAGAAAELPARETEKPRISHDLPQAAAPDPRMSQIQMNLASQSGLNPRRNRSLQEIIEEKWRHSRVDQLGHPVPAHATGKPVESPVENAVNAIRSAWKNPEIHDQLIEAISEISEVGLALEQRRTAVTDSAIRRNLEDLEAERLTTLGEIDRLQREKASLRETFKNEIREEEAEALREAVEKTRKAQEELNTYLARAEEARREAAFAQDTLDSFSDGRFEEKLREFALTSRAAEILKKPFAAGIAAVPSAETPTREEWIARTLLAFEMEGLEINEIEAANLLICASLSDSLLLTGPASADKVSFARALARVLGAYDAGRFADMHSSISMGRPNWLDTPGEIPGVVLVRNANRLPILDSVCGTAENLLTLSAIANDGFPVSAEVFERSFTLSIDPARSETPWNPEFAPESSFPPVRMQALRDAFLTNPAQIPPALDRRLQRVRDALAGYNTFLSRQTLYLMWKYCGAMIALGKVSAGEALDRAFAQKALPAVLAEASVECLGHLDTILADFPRSLALLEKPLPIQI